MKKNKPGPDSVLMEAFASREPAAADEIYQRFASRIYGLGIVMLGSDAAAQDLVQDTFVKVWRSADRFDESRGRLDTWVLLSARSLAIDSLRRRVLDSRTLPKIAPESEATPGPGPEELAATGDMADRARAAMRNLTDGQRAAIELAYFGGKTSAEIAELEGIPLGTAKTRIRTALLRLREVMEEHRREV